jgi:hypothetical protein
MSSRGYPARGRATDIRLHETSSVVARARTITGMCRSIKTLRILDVPATSDEVRAAALQYVRKVSGYRTPAPVNAPAFNAAVDEIAAASQRLLEAVTAAHPARHAAAAATH